MNTREKILTATVVGAAIGGVLGVLFAPAKGTETRKKLSENGKKLAETAKEKLDQFRHKMENGIKEKQFG